MRKTILSQLLSMTQNVEVKKNEKQEHSILIAHLKWGSFSFNYVTPAPLRKHLRCSFSQQKALADIPTPGPPHMGEHVTRS